MKTSVNIDHLTQYVIVISSAQPIMVGIASIRFKIIFLFLVYHDRLRVDTDDKQNLLSRAFVAHTHKVWLLMETCQIFRGESTRGKTTWDERSRGGTGPVAKHPGQNVYGANWTCGETSWIHKG